MGDQRRLREYIRLAVLALGSEAIRKPQLERLPRPARPPLRDRLLQSPLEKHQTRVEFAKELVRLIAARYGITLARVALKFSSLDDKAGRVQIRNGVWYIEIAEKFKSEDEQLASILAHEVAHVLMGTRRIGLEPELRNEELTDCIAALAGFGRIMLQANERSRVEYLVFFMREVTTHLGYLRSDALRWILRVQAQLSRDVVRRRWSRIDPARQGFVECPACATRLRLPGTETTIRLRCACCGLRQRVELRPQAEPVSVWNRILLRFDRWLRLGVDRIVGF